MAQEPFGAILKRRGYGVLFLVIVVGLVYLSIAIYNKDFTSTVPVQVEISSTGNQLQKSSDVKEDGLIVGTVTSVKSNGDKAVIQVALQPSMTSQIPSNVTAQILPKTLFGEQYVDLVRHGSSSENIQSHQTIYGPCQQASDHCTAAQQMGVIEAQKVLGDLLPLLTAVHPAQLNATLTALAQALSGRGNELGQTIVAFDNYLKIMNSQSGTGNTYVGQLADDLNKLGQVANEYNGVSPDLFSSLRNLLTGAHTLIQKQAQFQQLLDTGTTASGVLSSFLSENQNRFIAVSGQTKLIFDTLNVYSPEYSCLFAGINQLYDKAGQAIYDGAIHLSASPQTDNLGPYTQGQEPRFVSGFGPNCFGLPNNVQPVDSQGRFQIPEKFQCVNDGAPLTARGEQPNCKTNTSSSSTSAMNTPAEAAMVNALIASKLHTTPDKVPSASTLLTAPLYRGQDVVITK